MRNWRVVGIFALGVVVVAACAGDLAGVPDVAEEFSISRITPKPSVSAVGSGFLEGDYELRPTLPERSERLVGEDIAPGNSSSGQLRIRLTAAPRPGLDALYITVMGIQALRQSDTGQEPRWVEIDSDLGLIDLVELGHGNEMILLDSALEEGRYSELRLMLDCSEHNPPILVVEDQETPMEHYANCEAGILLTTGHGVTLPSDSPAARCRPDTPIPPVATSIHVEANTTTDLIADFDVRRSVLRMGGRGVYLRPIVRLEDSSSSGTILGHVNRGTEEVMIFAFLTGMYHEGLCAPFENAITGSRPNSNGDFTLPGLPAGRYDLVVATEDGVVDTSRRGIEVFGGDEIFLEQ
jgi:hypothetical protein